MLSTFRTVFRRIGPAIIAMASVLLIWQLITVFKVVPQSLFPPPAQIATAFLDWAKEGELWTDIAASMTRALVGFLMGGAIGIAIGLLTGRSQTIDNYLSPIIQLVRPLPPVAIIPLVILWFGIGEQAKIFSIAFAVFFPTWINTHLGARQVPKSYIWSANTLGVTRINLLSKIIFPSSFPAILAGLRNGIAVAFIMVFVAELAGASAGVGYQISVSHLAYRVDRMIAALLVLGFMGAASDFILVRFSQKLFPWLRFAGHYDRA